MYSGTSECIFKVKCLVTFRMQLSKKISLQFQCVAWKSEKALGNIPYDRFEISEEVQERVELVRPQLRRVSEKNGHLNSKMISRTSSQPVDKETHSLLLEDRVTGSLHADAVTNDNDEGKFSIFPKHCGLKGHNSHTMGRLQNSSTSSDVSCSNDVDAENKDISTCKNSLEAKKSGSITIPDDFLCPISLELMRDPVTTYERSYIQRWIDGGNASCPKTQQKLDNRTSDMSVIQALVRKLSSHSSEERKAAAAEIRSLSKRSMDNRILIADAGAIPPLVNLLTSEDVTTQENARSGSLADENKIIIGASGAIPALVDLLENGSTRGKKNAATALFNLCIYQENKGKAVRAGIITALLKMLTDSSTFMVDEALTILSVLAGHHEAKAVIVKASKIPVLIDLLRTSMPRNKENAAAILLALCQRDTENLACLSRLGAVIPLTEIAKKGTERGQRKANSLLEHLRKLQQL
ncbi:Armadillo [Dillenia turbinata]|uniref:RING-type E3 ubiquitin transferase n=1 Tax=Dillenia turbinata TaxID=194707 RepID=A0AAN8Z4D5_9MAGN